MNRIEADPIFGNVGSEEFVTKYVHHDTLAIANIAKLLVEVNSKEKTLQDVKERLQELRVAEKHNHLSTGENTTERITTLI